MSVHEGDRGESKMKIFIKAQALASYTVKICSNQKTFPPEYNNAITQDLVNTAKDIFIDCFTANEIMINPKSIDYEDNKKERRRLQNRARRNCNKLLALIEIAKPVFHLSYKRIRFWGSNTIEVRNMIVAWQNSDIKRFK